MTNMLNMSIYVTLFIIVRSTGYSFNRLNRAINSVMCELYV